MKKDYVFRFKDMNKFYNNMKRRVRQTLFTDGLLCTIYGVATNLLYHTSIPTTWKFSCTQRTDYKAINNKIVDKTIPIYGVFSRDVTAAVLVSQNKEMAAMLASQTKPLGIELYFYANTFFCFSKPIWSVVT